MTLALLEVPERRVLALDFGAPPSVEPQLDDELDLVLTNVEGQRARLWSLPKLRAEASLAERLRRTYADDVRTARAPQAIPLLVALGRLGVGTHVELVVEFLRHPDLEVQRATVEAVGRIGTEEQQDALTPFLRSGVAELEHATIIALSHFPTDLGQILVQAAATQRPALAGAAQIYEEQLRIAKAHDPDAYVRAYLHYNHYEDLVPNAPYLFEPLLEAGKRPEYAERVVYIWTMACDRQPVRLLATILRAPSAPIALRRLAALAMGRMRVRGAASILIEQLRASDPELQRNSVVALGRIGRTKALLPLLSTWHAQGGTLHYDICVAAYRLASPGGTDELQALLEAGAPPPRLFLQHGEEVVDGYHAAWIASELSSPLPAARRDALLLYAYYSTAPETLATLERTSRTDPDADVRTWSQHLHALRLRREGFGPPAS